MQNTPEAVLSIVVLLSQDSYKVVLIRMNSVLKYWSRYCRYIHLLLFLRSA